MITRKDYDVLIERVKVFAQDSPKAYKLKVFLLGLLGYAYIVLVLVALVVLSVGVFWLMVHTRGNETSFAKALLFLGLLVFAIIKCLWVKIERPKGFLLTEEKAPKLFALIKDISVKQRCPMPAVVLLNEDLNAFISQVPRLGIFGWYKNYLVLGLPYMIASDPGHFKAVMAHEFGHFSGAHGRMGTWAYRIRASWYNIMNKLATREGKNYIFGWFFNWYVPYFNAYSFVLTRQQEYEADRYASSYSGATANAEELVNAIIKVSAAAPYWQSVWARVNEEPLPPGDVFTKAVEYLKKPVPEEKYRDELRRSLKFRTQNLDTHPCLRERLGALGYSIDGERIVDEKGVLLACQKDISCNAAEEFLGQELIAEALASFDKEWAKSIEPQWKQRHAEVLKMKQELALLSQKPLESLNEKESVDRAYLIDQIASRKEAVTAIQELLVKFPNNAPAHYRLGELFLEESDEKAVEHLKKAMQLDATFASASLGKLSWYYEGKGEYDQVESALDNLDKTAENDQKDYLERNTVSVKDGFKEHGLPQEAVADLLKQLKAFENELVQVFLVQKILSVYPQEPMYVFLVDGKMKGFHYDVTSFYQKLLDKLMNNIRPKVNRGSLFWVVGDKALIKKVKSIASSLIFKKS